MANSRKCFWPSSSKQGHNSGEKSFFDFDLEPTPKFAAKYGTCASKSGMPILDTS